MERRRIFRQTGAALAIALSTFAAKAFEPAPIVFDTPAADEKGVMVLGNGEVGATAWIGADGVLHTVLQNSDSWNEGGRHVKTGAIDYDTKSPVDDGTYRQELSMARGEFEASWKSGGKQVNVRYRVQNGTDSIAVCDVRGAPDAKAKVVNWRLYPEGAREFGCDWNGLGNQCGTTTVDGKPISFTIDADRLVPGGWCHVNRNETVAELMKVYDYYQATGDLGKPDLLSDRVFGGVTRRLGGPRFVAAADGTKPVPPRLLFLSAITCLHPCRDEAEWLRRTNEMLDRDGWTLAEEDAKRAEHIAAWRAFWNRSHIVVTPAAGTADRQRKGFAFSVNEKLPISFGVDSRGGNRFKGKFAFAEVEIGGKKVYSGVPNAGDVIGTLDQTRGGPRFVAAADGTKPVPPHDGFRFSCRFATPDAAKPQRLIDNITPGKSDGFLVDLLNGRVRVILGKRMFTHKAKVPSGREVAVEVTVPQRGEAKITVEGESETFDLGSATIAEECAAVTLRYAAQRYLTACAGRGRLPIRFNGSIFTISHKGDPDYRRWGSGYWWQNTRLPYYPMFAAGDFDMTEPLFRMYFGLLDFNLKRTRRYLGHGGAFFPECMQPWGDHFPYVYGTKQAWKDRPDKLQDGGWHKYEWVGQLEVSLMAIMRWQHTQDTAWFKAKALPAIREYVRFFDEHYALDAKGRYNMNPAQAVETWWDCTNPMPEIAGLTRVTDLLLAMPDAALEPGDRELFAKIRSRVPELPTRTLENGGAAFAPAERFDNHRNVETPELYCVFPFRLCSFEKPNAKIGLRTYPVRFHKHYFGWAQDELNAAYLGLADEAAEHIADRALTHSKKIYRWPAYWGPNFDWTPDQDEGGVFQNTVQSMVVQYEGDRIFLLPAWPKDWNCDFRLHAPRNTVVEGRVVDGQFKELVVTPASRMADVQPLP